MRCWSAAAASDTTALRMSDTRGQTEGAPADAENETDADAGGKRLEETRGALRRTPRIRAIPVRPGEGATHQDRGTDEEESPCHPWPPLYVVQIGWDEMTLRERIKASGGRWNASRKVWIVSGAAVRDLSLQHRVVGWVEAE